ncbi:MAG: oxygenase MpaB family protein [Pseudomonadota bacterium]|nr:oxygenase MpaB family protein [Pseudomonadota bacterium]
MIAGVVRGHARIAGVTAEGQAYAATDPDLLDWVQATASFGFMEAYHRYARPLSRAERDSLLMEAEPAARLYGALGAPRSDRELRALFETMRGRLAGSPIVFEFLDIMSEVPVLPGFARPFQSLLIKAAVDILPGWVARRLELAERGLKPWERPAVRAAASGADRLLLRSSPAVQACRRLGLGETYLYGDPTFRAPV